MIDSFVLLTPILMLGVIALLGFVGCDLVFPPGRGPITVDIFAIVPSGSPVIDSVSTSYSLARAGNNLSVVSAEPDRMNIVNAVYGTDYHVREGFVEFDTSSIPDDAVIDSAILTLTSYRDEGAAALDQTVEARIRDFGVPLDTTAFVPGANLSALPLAAFRAVEPLDAPGWDAGAIRGRGAGIPHREGWHDQDHHS
jgi:hypothetical protein